MNKEQREDLKYLVEHNKGPLVFKNILNWNILEWSLDDWKEKLQNNKLTFRKSSLSVSKEPCWERKCTTVSLTMDEFIKFQENTQTKSSLYFDYKYMNEHFENYPEILESIDWTDFGYPNKSGADSTIWIGSKGAHTPCHMDTYGFNLVAQIYGSKEWILFPPETNMKPTRVPYEESSVYSKLNFFSPDTQLFSGLGEARSYILRPGDVLFVPNGWWHYVENLETAISVNMWLPLKQDHRKRVEEALTQIFIQQLTNNLSSSVKSVLLNPNSDELTDIPVSSTLQQLKSAIQLYQEQSEVESFDGPSPSKRQRREFEFDTYQRDPSTSCKRILNLHSNIQPLLPMSKDEFESLLSEKRSRYSGHTERKEKEDNWETELLGNIINSFCSPENIAKTTDTFLKDSFKNN